MTPGSKISSRFLLALGLIPPDLGDVAEVVQSFGWRKEVEGKEVEESVGFVHQYPQNLESIPAKKQTARYQRKRRVQLERPIIHLLEAKGRTGYRRSL